ncbi:class I SAM-dependent methyltransferase [Thermoleptolyngbya sp. C42_A2020_037]|uniref:class I SAM-dependent methyltransferase n=1 Tax=Thermoleptolyngbya sp. C42_A2020_037 TaxID=2747799 RepID=UPI0019EEB619|nr:class I SAM-dependent methyltransferase [Thermoleptolyngbya sp. C42_A2020_037]MBF2083494.1 class I SAM-dependent methyltransferase [Thermoleptolyngbya sp. C42_A2020_037]
MQPLSPTERLIKAYVDLGNTLYRQGDFAQSLSYFQQALDAAPDLGAFQKARLLYNIGVSYLNMGERDRAIGYFQQALELCPDLAPARAELQRIAYQDDVQAKGYEFTQDWFSRNVWLWQEQLQALAGRENLNALEIGSWEGRSACWLLENVLTHPTARLTCVDTFAGSSENLSLDHDTEGIEARFDANIARTGAAEKVTKRVGVSKDVVRSLPLDSFDFIYVDGSHHAPDVMTDGLLSWLVLKPGGILIFDDYDFGLKGYGTKEAIDAFLATFKSQLELLHQSHQVAVRKKA